MGREIRMVPPGWEHPKMQELNHLRMAIEEVYHPLYNRDSDTAFREWLAEYQQWLDGKFAETRQKHPEYGYEADRPYHCFCAWHGEPPDPKYYRPPWKEGEATWCQVYENVSEGTPVTPPFATKEELVDYLVTHGDFWDQKRGNGGWDRPNAESFVNRGWAPSMMVRSTPAGNEVKTPRDGTF